MDSDVKKTILSNMISVQQPLLIEVPRVRLLLILLAHWLLMYMLIVASVWLLVLFTVPFLTIVFVHYYGFAKIWRSHRYSLTLMNAFTFLVCCLAILTGSPVRSAIVELLFGLF